MNKRELKNMIDQQHESINHQLDTIALQAEIIRKLNVEIENKKSHIVNLREGVIKLNNAFDGLRRVLRRVMSQLALQNILQKTHTERNAENRGIVVDMKYWHDKSSDTYAHIQDIDDIPF
jgi:glucose-6-phosphate-specific signal transduction histidine kinase